MNKEEEDKMDVFFMCKESPGIFSPQKETPGVILLDLFTRKCNIHIATQMYVYRHFMHLHMFRQTKKYQIYSG